MKVLITGGAGFLGRRLAHKLVARGSLKGTDGRDQAIDEIVLLDVVPAESLADARIRMIVGDIADASLLRRAIDRGVGSVFHLAAIVSGEAEADFDLGMRVNVDACRSLLEACRAAGHQPRVVFTSSVAVYGSDLPATVLDSSALNPQSSYGTQKAIGELLINDYSRKGFIDGRVLRLPTIGVRPGKPNRAASSFASGIVREPLNGEQSTCPIAPETRVWLLSPRKAIEGLILGHELPAQALGSSRIVNLPGVCVTAYEMVAALERVAGAEAAKRVRWERDEVTNRIVASWPGAWDTRRAEALGFSGDADFDSIIRAYIEDELSSAFAGRA
ncbi:MAG: NAD-dependent epimerase [Betaproteobacteria bacterium RIFCSPLOWO2_12_FULL_62_58]|nr:MAG: NAD-dependent epimerase [Betaproteobacteria bacterium RIFCSPLOWO2_12_FULL_62_58]